MIAIAARQSITGVPSLVAASRDTAWPDVAGPDALVSRSADACWHELNAHADDIAALRAYAAPAFGMSEVTMMPLPDEPCVAAWDAYVREAEMDSAAKVLRRHLPQLRFAIAADTVSDPAYRAAVRLGVWPETDAWPGFADAEGISLMITATAAGRLPVIVARDRSDFERLVQALTKRNAPVPIPVSSGACMVSGYVNWGRVHAARRAWAAERGSDDATAWLAEFQRLRAAPALWQDRFMLLSAGAYAAVPAAALGLPDVEWRERSIALRREHEAAHYVTKRLYGAMHNALHDELLADYAGIVVAAGSYRTDWARRVLGIDEHGHLLPDARLLNYRGTPALGDRAMQTLALHASRAIDTIGRLDTWIATRPDASSHAVRALPLRTAALMALAETPLARMARTDALESMQQFFERALAACTNASADRP